MCEHCPQAPDVTRRKAVIIPSGRGRFLVETRGGPFMASRPLVGVEVWCNYRALDDAITDGAGDVQRAWERVAREQRDRYVAEVKRAIADKRRDAITARTVDATKAYQDALEAELRKLSEFAAKDMLAEIRAQVGGDWIPAPQSNVHAGNPEEISRSRAGMIAKQVNDAMQASLTRAALNVLEGGKVSALTRSTLPAGIHASATEAAALTINASRDRTAGQFGPEVESAQYSAVMDADTCSECESLDGREFKHGSAAYERAKPPNQRCLSNLNRTRGNQCRCVYVFRFKRKVAAA